jgi:peptidyl-dipeptidase A
VLKFHLHIAQDLLHQDLRNANYHGSPMVDDFLRGLMRPGASKDWRAVLREATGTDLRARAMIGYYEPLLMWIRQQNRGRAHTLGPAIPGGA